MRINRAGVCSSAGMILIQKRYCETLDPLQTLFHLYVTDEAKSLYAKCIYNVCIVYTYTMMAHVQSSEDCSPGI